jgi:hypothetical protein
VEVFDEIIKTRHQTRGLRISKQAKYMRHFTAHFEELSAESRIKNYEETPCAITV